jgi:hypothetical protein
MSWRHVQAVKASALPRALKAVAKELARYARDTDGAEIRPRLETVAEELGLSKRAVQYHVRKLEQVRILTVTAAARQHYPTTYRLHLERLPQRVLGPGPADQILSALEPPGVKPTAPLAQSSGVKPTAPLASPEVKPTAPLSVPGVKPAAPLPGVQKPPTRGEEISPDLKNVRTEKVLIPRARADIELPLTRAVPPRGAEHRAHAWCGRKCVPKFLHREFIQSIGGTVASRPKRLRAFYATTIGSIPKTEPIGEPPVPFWRTAFAVAFQTMGQGRRGAPPDPRRRGTPPPSRNQCPHTPTCVSVDACIDRQVAGYRERERQRKSG